MTPSLKKDVVMIKCYELMGEWMNVLLLVYKPDSEVSIIVK